MNKLTSLPCLPTVRRYGRRVINALLPVKVDLVAKKR